MPDRDDSILAIEGVEAGYFPDVPILNGVGVSIRPREIVTIVGPNGAGKSTLVKVVIGLLSWLLIRNPTAQPSSANA